MQTSISWTRFEEPLRRTLARNVAIAAVVGAVLAFRVRHLGLFLPFTALALWFSLGGHYVEVAFLNGIRPRISPARERQMAARVGVWFAGGAILYVLMAGSAHLLPLRPPHFTGWWFGGLLLIGVELLVHAGLALRGQPNFYQGLG
jgi:hypothetical protein